MISVSLVCVVLIVLEVIGGVVASSLAIISDAAHMFSDLTGFGISIMSLYLAQRRQNTKFTYGYHRSEIIGALCSIMMIWVITAFMVYEAIWRLEHLKQITIDAPIMFITAVCALISNVVIGTVLFTDGSDVEGISIHSHHGHSHSHSHNHSHDHKHKSVNKNLQDNENQNKDQALKDKTVAASRENYNMRAAMIHVLGDIVQSVGVVIAAVVIWCDPNLKYFDPICTLIFAIIVMCTTIPITGDCLAVLMECSPADTDWLDFQDKLQQIPGVVTVLDFHVWSLASGKPCLSAHIISTNVERTLRKATNMCRYNLFHFILF